MKRTLILVAISLFLCSTASAIQGGGGEATKKKADTKKKNPGTKSANTTPARRPVPPARPNIPTITSVIVNANLPNVTVTINGRMVGATDSNGHLVIRSLKRGVYAVSITKPGYQPDKMVVNLSGDQSETLNFKLKPITQGLTVSSTPAECEIYIDNVLRGRTDASGKVRLADVPVGEHRVTIRKSRYREAIFPLSLSSDKEGQIIAHLELAIGFLTVRTNAPNAGIDVSGIGHFDNSISKVECQPGTYTITIASPLYVTSRKEVSVSAGQEAQLSVDLVADTVARNRLASEALEAYSREQYERAITLAETLLSTEPKHSQALTVLAQSYFRKDDFDSFTKFGSQAINVGGSVEIPLRHHHRLQEISMHPVRLVLTAQTISFDPQVSRWEDCSYKAFLVSLQALGAVEVRFIGSYRTNAQHAYLQFIVVDLNNPKKTATLNFYDREMDPQTYIGRPLMDPRPQDFRAMSAIAALLNRAKASMGRK